MKARRQAGFASIGGLPPAPITRVEPGYSEEARLAKLQGTVKIALIVDAEGNPKDPVVIGSLGLGLDEKAVEAVKQWKFRPATVGGKPVAAKVTIEVNFRLR